jgi:hypothetical protein
MLLKSIPQGFYSFGRRRRLVLAVSLIQGVGSWPDISFSQAPLAACSSSHGHPAPCTMHPAHLSSKKRTTPTRFPPSSGPDRRVHRPCCVGPHTDVVTVSFRTFLGGAHRRGLSRRWSVSSGAACAHFHDFFHHRRYPPSCGSKVWLRAGRALDVELFVFPALLGRTCSSNTVCVIGFDHRLSLSFRS